MTVVAGLWGHVMLSSKVPTLQFTVYLLWGCDFSEPQFLLQGSGDGLPGGQVTTGVGCTGQGTAATGASSSPGVIPNWMP